jgi:hypothetical protein
MMIHGKQTLNQVTFKVVLGNKKETQTIDTKTIYKDLNIHLYTFYCSYLKPRHELLKISKINN